MNLTKAITLATMALGVCANATPHLWHLEHRDHISKGEAKGECSNFTGNWQGTCKFGDSTKPSELKITQVGCGSIGLADFQLPIGALTEISHAKRPNGDQGATFDSVTIDVEWAKKQTQLTFAENHVYKHLDAVSSKELLNQKDLNIVNLSDTFQLDGDKLVVKSNVTSAKTGAHSGTCEYTKK